jgi:hypothetical protein
MTVLLLLQPAWLQLMRCISCYNYLQRFASTLKQFATAADA